MDRTQAKLWEDQDESRRYEERMERMYFEAEKLEEQIADIDILSTKRNTIFLFATLVVKIY